MVYRHAESQGGECKKVYQRFAGIPEGRHKLCLELLQQELLRQERVPGVAKLGKHSLQQLQAKWPQCLHLKAWRLS